MENAEFNYLEGQRRKIQGIEKAASYPFDTAVGRARNVAILLARRFGTVTADDVHKYLQDHLPDVLEDLQPNSWGAILKSPKLKFDGQVRQSNRVSRHTGIQRVWVYHP